MYNLSFTITYKVNVPNILWNAVYEQCREAVDYNHKTIMKSEKVI